MKNTKIMLGLIVSSMALQPVFMMGMNNNVNPEIKKVMSNIFDVATDEALKDNKNNVVIHYDEHGQPISSKAVAIALLKNTPKQYEKIADFVSKDSYIQSLNFSAKRKLVDELENIKISYATQAGIDKPEKKSDEILIYETKEKINSWDDWSFFSFWGSIGIGAFAMFESIEAKSLVQKIWAGLLGFSAVNLFGFSKYSSLWRDYFTETKLDLVKITNLVNQIKEQNKVDFQHLKNEKLKQNEKKLKQIEQEKLAASEKRQLSINEVILKSQSPKKFKLLEVQNEPKLITPQENNQINIDKDTVNENI